MSRRLMATAFSVVLSALMLPSIHAQDQRSDAYVGGPMLMPAEVPSPSRPARLAPEGLARPVSHLRMQGGMNSGQPPTPIDASLAQAGQAVAPIQQPGYVQLGAPMYPTPRPNIPIWSGSTVITNQAFAPHEMMHAHTYRGIYPPFYHRVRGGWILTPLGVRSHEKWELQGTMVQVKYRSSYPGILSGHGWHPPATSYSGGAWR